VGHDAAAVGVARRTGLRRRPSSKGCRAAAAGLADGAWGMSTEAVYPPARTPRPRGRGRGVPGVDGLYASHIRNERRAGRCARAVEIDRVSVSRVEVSHSRRPAGSHGRAAEALQVLTRRAEEACGPPGRLPVRGGLDL
jgi:hypothetical protein